MKQFRDTQYWITPDGRVLSKYPLGGAWQREGKPTTNKERWLTKSQLTSGYKTFGTRKQTFTVHQAVMELYGPPSPGPGFVVDHIDKNKHNNDISNLQWLTIGENVAKACSGEDNANAKLTEQAVLEIRAKYKPRKYTRQMLAEEYSVQLATIRNVLEGRTWRHLLATS